MNNVIKYIIMYDRITNLPEHATRLLFLYNNKNNKRLVWLSIAWTPLPYEIQKKIVYVYRSKSYLDSRMYELMLENYVDRVILTMKDLYEKTFIKFLYDLNYIDKDILSLLKNPSKYYQINPGIVLNCNHHYKLQPYEISKINETKQKNTDFYVKISEIMDKKIIKKFGYYIRELIKIDNIWWLITTGYEDKIEEDKDVEKIIHWIFAEII